LLTSQEFHFNLSTKNQVAHNFFINWNSKVDSAIFFLTKKSS
jgi:hypothetical protein